MRAIPRGYLGTRATVDHIKHLILEGAKDFYVRQKAIDVLMEREVAPKNYLGEIRALFEWVREHVRYTKDPYRVELIHSPRRMLELRAGDCDDMAILLGAMLEAVGHPVRLVVVGSDPRRPRLFSHIYLEANHRGRWIALDPTMPYPMGWSPRTWVRNVIPIRRRTPMMNATELAGAGPLAIPWARRRAMIWSLIRAVRRDGLRPRDPRVRFMWRLLRTRGVLNQSPWLRSLLRSAWARGLRRNPRPVAARRMVAILRRQGILPRRRFRGPLVCYPRPGSYRLVSPRSLTGTIAAGGLRPHDPRVRTMWYVLRRRGVLNRNPWLKRVLRFMWTRGLSPRPHPLTAGRMRAALRSIGIVVPFRAARRVPFPIAPLRPPFPFPRVSVAPPLLPRIGGYVRTDGSEIPLSIRPAGVAPAIPSMIVPLVPGGV